MRRASRASAAVRLAALATAILFAALPSFAQVGAPSASAKPRLVVMRFIAGDGIKEAEARQINELFESAVIKTTVFDIVDRARALVLAAGSDLPSDFSDLESALALAKAAKADFVIVGTITVSGAKGAQKYSINPRLAAADTGKEAFSTPTSFVDKDKIKALGDLAVKIATAARQRSDVTKAQIEAFMKMGDWDNAERFLEIFEKSRTADADRKAAAALRQEIDKSVAETRFLDARKALDLFLYDEARRAINEAMRRDPANERFRELERTIESEHAKKMSADDDKVLAQVDDLVESRRWDSAASLLGYLESRGSRDGRIQRLRELVGNGVKARDLHAAAKADLEAGDYESALLAVNSALAIFPDDVDLLRTKNAIVAAEKREASSKAKWELYFEELKHVDLWGLFLIYKPARVDLHAALEYPSLDYVLPLASDGDWTTILTDESLGATAWYRGNLWRPKTFPLSSASFDVAWFGGARAYRAGYERRHDAGIPIDAEEAALPYAWSEGSSFFAAEAFGGAEARLTALSFAFTLGLEAGTGFESAAFASAIPYLGVERSRSDAWWRLSGGVRYGIAWLPVPSIQVFAMGRTTWPLVVGPSEAVSDLGESAWSFGVAVPFKP